MSEQKRLANPYPSAELDSAMEALSRYGPGSSRAALIPIDSAVIAALPNPSSRKALEQRLLSILAGAGSHEAIEYICSKLALIGSEASAAALGKLLNVQHLSAPARNALEKIPSSAAGKVLRGAAMEGACLDRVGAIQSLARLRDPAAVPLLRKMLPESDPEVAAAAAFALGAIGTSKAGEALMAFLPHAPVRVRGAVADAVMVCAERLVKDGQLSRAKSLYGAVIAGPFAPHICQAAKNALTSI